MVSWLSTGTNADTRLTVGVNSSRFAGGTDSDFHPAEAVSKFSFLFLLKHLLSSCCGSATVGYGFPCNLLRAVLDNRDRLRRIGVAGDLGNIQAADPLVNDAATLDDYRV